MFVVSHWRHWKEPQKFNHNAASLATSHDNIAILYHMWHLPVIEEKLQTITLQWHHLDGFSLNVWVFFLSVLARKTHHAKELDLELWVFMRTLGAQGQTAFYSERAVSSGEKPRQNILALLTLALITCSLRWFLSICSVKMWFSSSFCDNWGL